VVGRHTQVILASRSEYFGRLFSCGLKESREEKPVVEIKELSSHTFLAMLKYVYVNDVDFADRVPFLLSCSFFVSFFCVFAHSAVFVLCFVFLPSLYYLWGSSRSIWSSCCWPPKGFNWADSKSCARSASPPPSPCPLPSASSPPSTYPRSCAIRYVVCHDRACVR